jgi:SWIM zinc finger
MPKTAGPAGAPEPHGDYWRVPSSDGVHSYIVRVSPRPSCTCGAFVYARVKLGCRHIRAVKALVRQGGGGADGK